MAESDRCPDGAPEEARNEMPHPRAYCQLCIDARQRVRELVTAKNEAHIIGTPEFEQWWRNLRGEELLADGQVESDDEDEDDAGNDDGKEDEEMEVGDKMEVGEGMEAGEEMEVGEEMDLGEKDSK
jgi:hypothetical protein